MKAIENKILWKKKQNEKISEIAVIVGSNGGKDKAIKHSLISVREKIAQWI
jgi:hypothetical protein